jgi:Bacterial regulatory proteins, luxR family
LLNDFQDEITMPAMRLVCAGLMNKKVAAEIGLSVVTVKVHRHNLMKKLNARSFADLVEWPTSCEFPAGRDHLNLSTFDEPCCSAQTSLSMIPPCPPVGYSHAPR